MADDGEMLPDSETMAHFKTFNPIPTKHRRGFPVETSTIIELWMACPPSPRAHFRGDSCPIPSIAMRRFKFPYLTHITPWQ